MCLCCVACFVVLLCVTVSGFVCCVGVGSVLGFVSLCYVVWWRVLCGSAVVRCLVVCCVVVFCCCELWSVLMGFRSAALFCGSFCGSVRFCVAYYWPFCWYVSCASLLRRVAPCYVLLCSIVTSYGSCFVSWRYACCVVVTCLGALGCTLVCGVGHFHAVLCVVTWRFVVLCSMLCCVMAYRCLVVFFGVVYLVGGLVVLSCVSALRGVV